MKKSLNTRFLRYLREWHRRLGIIAAFFLIFLSLTGIALNHTTSLLLAHMPIKSTWLLDHYGISSPSDVRFYQPKGISVTNNMVWLNDKLLFESASKVVGVASINVITERGILVVVNENQLYLYNHQGELLDQLGSESGVPNGITAMAFNENKLIVKTHAGYYQTDYDFFDWQLLASFTEPLWIQSQKADEKMLEQAKLRYRAQFLTWERIILDAHSGRIVGLFGVLFMDAIGFLLILLSLSGIYIWIRYTRTKR